MGTQPRQRKKSNQKQEEHENVSSEQAAQEAIRKKMRTKTKKKGKSTTSKQLYYWAILVGGIAIVGWLSMYLSNLIGEYIWTDPATREFLKTFVCNDPDGGYCHSGLVPYKRSQKASTLISPGETILKVPRHLQIWDLDALRDDFIRTELASARHVHTLNPLHSGAFLAAYLALRVHQSKDNEGEEEDPMRPYFDMLPTFEQLETFHPALWSEEKLGAIMETHSWAYSVTRGYHDMLRSEYTAFAIASKAFSITISQQEYKAMRINVLSRSFGAGPPTEEQALPNQSLDEELDYYKATMGVDLTKGCHAMVPILDMYDHHPRPNVGWKYDSETGAFVIDAVRAIPPGQVLVDSYGKYTDAHLFSKYGFVNGDGSGHTEVSIGIMHKPFDIGMREQFSYLPFETKSLQEEEHIKYQRELVARYMIFDDGYDDCIQKELHPKEYEFKKLKFELVMRIANEPKQWLFTMQPRTENSLPAMTTETPITFNPPDFDVNNLKLDASKVIETCRLIALSERDFDGNASAVMKEALESDEPLVVDNQGPDLEYRALAVLSRLTGVARGRFQTEMETVMKLVRKLTYENFQSPEWTIAQIRLGEIQTLEVLHRVAFSGMLEMADRIKAQAGEDVAVEDVPIPFIRDKPCPSEYTQVMLNEGEEGLEDKQETDDDDNEETETI